MFKSMLAYAAVCLCLPTLSYAKHFRCADDLNNEPVEGLWSGTFSDTIVLAENEHYRISRRGSSEPLELAPAEKRLKAREFADLGMQYLARETDDIGTSTTWFAVPLGTFGRNGKEKFRAALKVTAFDKTSAHSLQCETL